MFFLSFPSYSDNTFFIDFSRVLNQSNAGANAQNTLKKKFESENLKFKKKDDEIKKTEADIISQKKVLSSEEYKKKVDELRNQVLTLQKEKQDALNSIAKSRAKAKEELLKSVNPILKKYMEEKNIRLVIDKQNIVLGDMKLEITDDIIKILNQELKSINIK